MIEPLRGCARHADDLPGFVDQSLPAPKLGAIAAHLASCPACREEVAALREVHALLQGRKSVGARPELSERLRSIAGDEGDTPLWLAKSGGELPSKRRRRTRAALAAAASGTVLAVVLVAVGFMLAPNLRSVIDPEKLARQAFSKAIETSGSQDSAAVLLRASAAGAELTKVGSPTPRPVPLASPVVISATEGAAWLNRARQAQQGEQLLSLAVDDAWIAGTAEIRELGPNDLLVVLRDAQGREYRAELKSNEALAAANSGCDFYAYPVASNGLEVLEARMGDRLVARWWLNSGALVWHERYSAKGRLAVVIEPRTAVHDRQDALGALQMNAPVNPVAAKCAADEVCPPRLAGLDLVGYSTSGVAGSRQINLVYSDAVNTVSITVQPGFLAPGGSPQTQFSADGMPQVLAWQSGQKVVVASTNGGADLLSAVRAEFPSEAPAQPDVMWQISSGLKRLFGLGDN